MRHRLSWLLLSLLALASLLATLPLSLLSGQLGYGTVAVVIGIPCAAVGVVVARRQPGNPLGWLFLVTGILLLISNDAADYAYYVYRLGHRLPFGPAALAIDQLWTAGLVLFVMIILLFPDGRLPSVFWRWALRVFCALYLALLAAVATATAGALAAHPVRIDAAGGLSAIDNPGGWFAAVQHSILLARAGAVCGLHRPPGAELAALVRRAAPAAEVAGERRGLRDRQPRPGLPAEHPAASGVDNLILCGVAALPVAMGVAILRYRLYDIDRLISRTLAYAIVTGLLVGVYAALALAAGALRFHGQATVAVATLAAAALFNPLRRRVQRVVDRRFNRARYDADVTVAAFATRLKDAVELDTVRTDLTSVVHATLEPTHVRLWLAEPP